MKISAIGKGTVDFAGKKFAQSEQPVSKRCPECGWEYGLGEDGSCGGGCGNRNLQFFCNRCKKWLKSDKCDICDSSLNRSVNQVGRFVGHLTNKLR